MTGWQRQEVPPSPHAGTRARRGKEGLGGRVRWVGKMKGERCHWSGCATHATLCRESTGCVKSTDEFR